MARILIVDDEPEIVRGLEDNLRFEGYQTLTAGNGADALAVAAREAPDLIVLDLMMPVVSGWDVCRTLRARGIDVPIIMLTARGEEAERVRGLELGADDYLTKPFSLREELAFDDVRVRSRGRQVFKAGHEVMLTRKEFDLLLYLLAHRGEVITRERLLDEVWGYERFPTTRTVDTHVLRLRRKFEADPEHPRFILTVHGQGYRFAGS